MPDGLKNSDWNFLVKRIGRGECTPLLGPDAGFVLQPSATEVARQWSHEYDYPLDDDDDIARVAQFLAVTAPSDPKGLLREWLDGVQAQDYDDPSAPYNILADLPLPLYITTSHDDYLAQALQRRERPPRRVLCLWNEALAAEQARAQQAGFSFRVDELDPVSPVVFHLYGHAAIPASLVLTEDDYLDFLVSISREQRTLPTLVQGALGGTSLLFLGFHLIDWRFRVLLRVIASVEASLRMLSITVQLPPVPEDVADDVRQRVRDYLSAYFQRKDVRAVYWGSTRQFAVELRQRWQEYMVAQPAVALARAQPAAFSDIVLRAKIMRAFSLHELRVLVHDLGEDFESIPGGDVKELKVMELIAYCRRRELLVRLVAQLRKSRPEIAWDTP
jgi:hypothetical protein